MKSTTSLFTAAIESARIFNHAVRECADSAGLLTLLHQPRTIDEIIRCMAFHPKRRATLERLLGVLVSEGMLDELTDRLGGIAYARAAAAVDERVSSGRYVPHTWAISDWYGDAHVELIRSSNKAFLGRDLNFFRSEDIAIGFNKEFEGAWRANLQNPLYEFGRLRCVKALVSRGTRFLDLACGPGFGIRRLAEFCPKPCTIVAVDKSADFLDIARNGQYPAAKVTFIRRDLNLGLPPTTPGSLDGILFNGAFHFISDKLARLHEMRAALRPGGLLVVGHCFSRSGYADEAMHDFYFSLLDDRVWPIEWSTLKGMVVASGFALIEEFHRGSHSYMLAERPLDGAIGESAQ